MPADVDARRSQVHARCTEAQVPALLRRHVRFAHFVCTVKGRLGHVNFAIIMRATGGGGSERQRPGRSVLHTFHRAHPLHAIRLCSISLGVVWTLHAQYVLQRVSGGSAI